MSGDCCLSRWGWSCSSSAVSCTGGCAIPTVRAVTMVVVGTTVVQLLAAGLYLRYWVPLAAVLQIPVLALLLLRLDRRIALSGMLLLTLVLSVREVRPWLDNDPGSRIAASVDGRRAREDRPKTGPTRSHLRRGQHSGRRRRDRAHGVWLRWVLPRWPVGVR